MNTLDYFIVCILAAPTVTGIFKGFIRTVLGLLGIIGGIVLSMAFARPLGVAIGQFFGAKDFFVGKLLSFIIIFSLTSLAGFILAALMHRIVSLANLSFLNRLLGGLLGLVQGLAISGAILTIVYLIPSTRPWIDNSSVSLKIVNGAAATVNVLPDEWIDYLLPERWIGSSRQNILNVLKDGEQTLQAGDADQKENTKTPHSPESSEKE